MLVAVLASLALAGATPAAAASDAAGTATTANGNFERELPAALRRHVEALSADIGERTVLAGDSLERARQYIRGAFAAAGLAVSEQVYRYEGRSVANVVGDLPGRKPGGPPAYVIGAHYDTVPGTPGADDNASGVAAMIELARHAAADPPDVPVRFVAFALEEAPVFGTPEQGSRVFIRRAREAGEEIAAAIVLEMVGMTTPRQFYPPLVRWLGYPEAGDFIGVIGNGDSRRFGGRLIEGLRRNPDLPVESLFVWFDGRLLPDTRRSDHYSFWQADIPAVMVTDTANFRNPNYHRPGDRPETLDYAFMAELVQGLGLALEGLGETP